MYGPHLRTVKTWNEKSGTCVQTEPDDLAFAPLGAT